MISVDEARARILADLAPVGTEILALDQAAGRVLARAIHARLDQPPARLSAMDGFAVRAAEASQGLGLRIVGESAAGHPFTHPLGAGEAVRISTGAWVPDGADTILLREDAAEAPGFVRAGAALAPGRPLTPGRHVRLPGQDFTAGAALVAAGRRLTPRDIGLIAAGNHGFVTLHRRPRIAILATGDELSLPGPDPAPGSIVSSNGHALAAFIAARGGQAQLLPIAPDQPDAIVAAARQAAGSDLLVTIGGASVGDHDLVQSALLPAGFTCDFWRVAMRPGKPLIHGRLGTLPLLGLPGNPVSALVTAILFLLPALARLGGEQDQPLPFEPLALATNLPAGDGRAEYLRARLVPGPDGPMRVAPFTDQASSLLRVLAEADALLLRPPHAPPSPAGAPVPVLRLAPLGI